MKAIIKKLTIHGGYADLRVSSCGFGSLRIVGNCAGVQVCMIVSSDELWFSFFECEDDAQYNRSIDIIKTLAEMQAEEIKKEG